MFVAIPKNRLVYCRNCGQSLSNNGAKFCSNCGSATEGGNHVPYDEQSTPENKGTSKIKIIGIAAGAIIGVFIIIAIAAASVSPGNLHETSPENIQGISQFIVSEQGSSVVARFSLVTADNVYATSNAKVSFKITDGYGREVYSQNFDIKSSDFAEYKLILTGQPVIAYSWFLNKSPSAIDKGGYPYPEATITVTLPDGKTSTAKNSVLL